MNNLNNCKHVQLRIQQKTLINYMIDDVSLSALMLSAHILGEVERTKAEKMVENLFLSITRIKFKLDFNANFKMEIHLLNAVKLI